ncbi:hypothetical protein [Gynuella sunshinyii]|uniref:Uncharacterized protein n=1 Tax=Gynuella sunshinyii YC6258 TaxID=1445510 RepID=A0A0C5VDR4_9GAMM|nr:hypothetical protein [Gynuella sunshinyii]AJQ92341.1 hypothetical Protein YC6258_00291 [Gynuella sunshinyii YC6258]
MLYSKPMIELVYEIRRRVPSHLKPDIKLANPDLLDELLLYYQKDADTIVKALIKELMQLAGDPWTDLLTSQESSSDQYVTKTYRGALMLEPRKAGTEEKSRSSRKMYRGQMVSG